jgi:hypothetical protein
VLGLMCLILALVVALPIPLGNLPPAVCVVAFGMPQRNGFIVAGALVASATVLMGMTAALALAGSYLLEALGGMSAT